MVVTGSNSPPVGERFVGARVVVTGGARGIGAAIARSFAAQGASIAVLDRLVDECDAVADELSGVAVICDLADPAATTEATQTSIDRLGGIDVLVNNAGVFRITPLLDISADEWDWIFSINTRAMLLTTQVAARSMIAAGRGGKIVNMASMGGKVGAAGQAHYAASKAAVISLTQVSATELGVHGDQRQLDLPRLRAHRDGCCHPHRRDGRGVVGEVAARAVSPSRPTWPTWPCSSRRTTPTTSPARRSTSPVG